MSCYTFLWEIQNYSYCWHQKQQSFESPEFTADDLQGTSWYLKVFPKGNKYGDCIAMYLHRNADDEGPYNIVLEFQLSVLAANGSPLRQKECLAFFQNGNGRGSDYFLHQNDVHSLRKGQYLSQDTLRVRCKMWPSDSKFKTIKQISARTRVRIERISFHLVAESFSTLQPDIRSNMQVSPISENGLGLSGVLYYTSSSRSKEKIKVEITPNKIIAKCKIYLVDKYGKLLECGATDNTKYRLSVLCTRLNKNRQAILDDWSIYLPDGNLSLKCECMFANEFDFSRIEGKLCELPVEDLDQLSDNNLNKDLHDGAESLNEYPGVPDDLKALYKNQLLTDIEVKTKSNSFPAHKNVLCARSSVFQAMLTNDMKEKNTNCIELNDLEDDIVHQFLLFLYSDQLENLQWDSAIKLYYAGDKYLVKKLKASCTSFLLDNLSTTRACELLLLADTHNDSQLRKNVQDFILQHAEEVFGSEEWESLMEENSRLASETMHLRYKRRRI